MKTTVATLAALAVVAALPAGASARPDVPSTCDILKNTGCDLQPPVCLEAINLGGQVVGGFCPRPYNA